MAEMIVCDRLKELSILINQQHLVYLQLDESPRKIEQREKLESYIKEYLCIAPHDAKFSFSATADILHRSASSKDNFSGYRAALAWKAIGKYADNLLAQPWRKEYRDIKLYCGFYKHEIEESLVGAEHMFEVMGYRHSGHQTMALPDILDPDRITDVSKDAITAFVECQIMKQIWEAVSVHHHFSWLEILQFRENCTGTPDQAIRSLTFKFRQRQHQEQGYSRPQQIRGSDIHHSTRSDCLYNPNAAMGYYSHMHNPSHSYSFSNPARFAPLISSQQIVPPPVIYQTPVHPTYVPSHHVIKAQDYYPTNGYHVHSPYICQVNPTHQVHNGYSAPPVLYQVPSAVPTGQLIELDSTPPHNESEMYTSRTNNHRYHTSQDETNLKWHSVPEPVRNHDGPISSRKAKDDGAGSWENWDYVFKSLNNQGYKNRPRSRGDVLPPKGNYTSSQNNSTDIDFSHSDVSDKLRKISIEPANATKSDVSLKVTPDNPNRTRTEGDGEARSKNIKIVSESEVDGSSIKEHMKYVLPESKSHRTSPEKVRRESIRRSSESASGYSIATNKSNYDKSSEIEKDLYVKDNSNKSLKSRENSRTPNIELADSDEKWECYFCTFLNSASQANICEVCSKSRDGSELKPQPTGGQQCSTCTLVNEPGLTRCAACEQSLENTATFI